MKFDSCTFQDMLKLASEKPELTAKEEIVDGVTLTIFSYMLQKTDTFDSDLALEFRGCTFRNDTGECISRPFPKFFNVGEKPETQLDKLNLEKARYFVKHDGSMAIPVLINGKIFWKTKKSFYSDVAQKIQKFYDSLDWSIPISIMGKYTPIYEYVGPENRIVLDYNQEELIFLGYRCIESGIFLPYEGVESHDVDFSMIYGMENVEGFVIHDGSKMVKAKTEWYIQRHSIMTEFNPKRIIQASLDDTIDDMIGMVYQLGLPERAKNLEELRDKTLNQKIEFIQNLEKYFNNIKHLTRKEFALEVIKKIPGEYHGSLFKMYDQKSYKETMNKVIFEKVYSEYKPCNGESE